MLPPEVAGPDHIHEVHSRPGPHAPKDTVDKDEVVMSINKKQHGKDGDRHKDKPQRADESGYSTLNDGATLWGMKAMLLGWHLTDDRKYLDALEKAGQWVIDAQLPGKACGWAEQYGDDGKPAWARDFEPPATCVTSIGNAAEALFLLYDLTGDDKYLSPLGRCVQWGLDMPDYTFAGDRSLAATGSPKPNASILGFAGSIVSPPTPLCG